MAKVLSIFQQTIDGELAFGVEAYPSIDGDFRCRATDKGDEQLKNASSIIDVLVLYVDRQNSFAGNGNGKRQSCKALQYTHSRFFWYIGYRNSCNIYERAIIVAVI